MSITSTQLGALLAELHEVNAELADAARPLERLPDLNDDQRDGVAARLRAGLARWERLTRRIDEVLGGAGKGGGEKAHDAVSSAPASALPGNRDPSPAENVK
jgi:hypothetical protein